MECVAVSFASAWADGAPSPVDPLENRSVCVFVPSFWRVLIFLRRRPGYRPPGYRYRVAGHQATSHQLRGTGRQVSRYNVQGRSPKTKTVTKTKIESPAAVRRACCGAAGAAVVRLRLLLATLAFRE